MKKAIFVCLVSAWLSTGAYASENGQELNVVTLNLAEETRAEQVAAEVRDADVILLQEVLHDQRAMPARLGERLGYHVEFAPAMPPANGASRGIAILSRYKLSDPHVVKLPEFDLRFNQRQRIALAVTAATPMGPVRVFNVHLDNRLNAADRIRQLAPVLAEAGRFAGGCLIGGDFNSAHIYWLGRVVPIPYVQAQPKAIQAAMAKRGFSTPLGRTGPTFDFFGLELDWIYLKQLKPVSWRVKPVQFSDHHSVWMRLAMGA